MFPSEEQDGPSDRTRFAGMTGEMAVILVIESTVPEAP
jgi:hypothetical protein